MMSNYEIYMHHAIKYIDNKTISTIRKYIKENTKSLDKVSAGYGNYLIRLLTEDPKQLIDFRITNFVISIINFYNTHRLTLKDTVKLLKALTPNQLTIDREFIDGMANDPELYCPF